MPKTNEYKESLLSTQNIPGLVYSGKEVDRFRSLLSMPHLVKAEKCRKNFYYFVEEFFETVCQQEIVWNWHMKFLCDEMQEMAWRAIKKLPKKGDMIINVPPGSTKSTICSVMFPAWVWCTYAIKKYKIPGMDLFHSKTIRGFSSSFICASYSSPISINLAQKCLDVIKSEKYKLYFPELAIREEKGARQSFQISRFENTRNAWVNGGERFTTSVGGSATGMHGDFIIIDDPLNPKEAASDAGIKAANTWMTETIPTRKTSKESTPTVLIMQRLHQNDPTGYLLEKRGKSIYHIKLPAELKDNNVKPEHLAEKYVNNLLDPIRGSRFILKEMQKDLGQYAYHAQFQQEPTPPQGGMFQVNKFVKVSSLEDLEIKQTVRYWDKAGTEGGDGAYTVGVKMASLRDGRFIVLDVRRERFGTDRREKMIRDVAVADGRRVLIWFEQEGGSGGKESAEHSIKSLAGFVAKAEMVSGDKIYRADPLSVQVNNGNILLLEASWNHDFIEEFRFFPYSRYKDQVDAASGAFNKLALKKRISII